VTRNSSRRSIGADDAEVPVHGPAFARVYLDYRAAAGAADRPGQFDLVRRGTGVEECARVDRYVASSSHRGRPNARSETCDDDGSDKTVAQAQWI
jgi:hypothetical protein